MIQREEKIYATNLTDEAGKRKSMYDNDWRIIVSHAVPNASAICGVKIEHPKLKHVYT
jgi:hypothetical protein